MHAGKARTRLLVSIDDDHATDVSGVVDRLRALGMEVDRTMEALGTVSGSIEFDRLAALQDVEGVAAVEPAREHQLPPPDSDLQ